MENSQLETLESSQNPPFTFPPPRRRPLQSETYRTFVKIMSRCYALQSQGQHEKQGEAAEGYKVGVDRPGEAAERNELLDHDPMETDSLLGKQNSAADVTHGQAIGFQGGDITGKPMEGDMLDTVDITTNNGNGNHVDSFMEDYLAMDGSVHLIVGRKGGCNVKDSSEASLTGQEKVDKQALPNEVLATVDSSLELDMVVSRPIKHGDEKNSTEEKTMSEGIEQELLMKEQELEKLICSSSAMNSTISHTADDGIEEGEISGDIGVYDEAINFLFDDADAVSLEDRKVGDPQICKDISAKEEIACDSRADELGKNDRSISASLNIDDNGMDIMKLERQSSRRRSDSYAETLADLADIEIKEVDEQDIALENGEKLDQVSGVQGMDHSAASVKDDQQVFSEGAVENKSLVTNEEDNSIEKKKRKKGPLSKERKAKKKKKERIKRAEKNRKLGVKRLKLQLVSKPKTVTYCRHYLKGRCQEGEKCKFSHDTTPLTKSKPCCHFARHSCMKGDDCPFDHQLSKYPCNNYVTKGFCVRGADCLFSHTMAEKESSLVTSNVPKAEVKSPSQTSDSNSKTQVKIHANPPQHSSGKNAEKKEAQQLQRPATQAPKGISLFSSQRLSSGERSNHEQAAHPLRGDYGVKVGSKIMPSSCDSHQKLNDITKRTPVKTPKGINFLSFGKSPLPGSGSNKDHGISESLLGELKQSTSFMTPNDGRGKIGSQSGQSFIGSESNQNRTANMISPPTSAPQGIKFFAFGEARGDNSSVTRHVGLPLVQKREKAADALKFSKEMACGSASSSNPFRQSSHHSDPRNAVGMSSSQDISLLSTTPSSVQKALQSTLAFAAKFDTQIKLDQSIGNPDVSTNINQQSSSMSGR